MNFDELFEKFMEENKDKLGVTGKCPVCGGLVGYNWIDKVFECIDCQEFQTDDIESIDHWRVD